MKGYEYFLNSLTQTWADVLLIISLFVSLSLSPFCVSITVGISDESGCILLRQWMIWLEAINSESGKSSAVWSLYHNHDPITSPSLHNLQQPFRSITTHCCITVATLRLSQPWDILNNCLTARERIEAQWFCQTLSPCALTFLSLCGLVYSLDKSDLSRHYLYLCVWL